MDSIPSNLTPDCPPPLVYEKTEKISEKNYKIKSNEKEYERTHGKTPYRYNIIHQ